MLSGDRKRTMLKDEFGAIEWIFTDTIDSTFIYSPVRLLIPNSIEPLKQKYGNLNKASKNDKIKDYY